MAEQQPIPAAQMPRMPVDVKRPVPMAAAPAQDNVFQFSEWNLLVAAASCPPTPPGWIRAQTPDGKPIFVHTATQQCSFQFPTERVMPAAPAPPTAPVAAAIAKPQLTRISSTPTPPGSAAPAPAPANPNLRRSATMPVHAHSSATAPKDPALMTMTLNTTVARKSIPGFDEAHAIHQLSSRNNTQVLGKKLGADVAHASIALKDTTITAASLATRQARVVGQTMVSKTKMQKASKKAIVHTGALGVKIGRASKNLMHEMVDAADGKGKYKPKARSFVPQDPLPVTAAAGQKHKVGHVHAYEYEQAAANAAAQGVQQAQQAVVPAKPMTTGVPVRKPVKTPSVTVEFKHSTTVQTVQPASLKPPTNFAQQSPGSYVETEEYVPTNPEVQQTISSTTTAENPPQPTVDVNASVEIAAQATLDMNLTGSHGKPPAQTAPATTATPHPLQQSTRPSVSFAIQADGNASASFTYQPQSSSNQPPPPYSPQMQAAQVAPTTVVRPQPQQRPPGPTPSFSGQPQQQPYTFTSPTAMQQPMQPIQQQQYVMMDPAPQQPQHIVIQQQQPQQIIIQQPDSGADAYLQASSMMALQQQMQALQMQQQVQQMQSVQQQQVIDQSVYQQQVVDQSACQRQITEQPDYQQSMVQPQDTTQDVYFVDSSTNVQTSMGGEVYQQQEQQYVFMDANGTTMYAQETTTEVYATDGSAMYVDESAIVYEQDYGAGEGGGMVYAEEVEVYEVEGEAETGMGEGGGFEEVECEEVDVEAECEFECDF